MILVNKKYSELSINEKITYKKRMHDTGLIGLIQRCKGAEVAVSVEESEFFFVTNLYGIAIDEVLLYERSTDQSTWTEIPLVYDVGIEEWVSVHNYNMILVNGKFWTFAHELLESGDFIPNEDLKYYTKEKEDIENMLLQL